MGEARHLSREKMERVIRHKSKCFSRRKEEVGRRTKRRRKRKRSRQSLVYFDEEENEDKVRTMHEDRSVDVK